jgi:hypothetical protein
MRQRSYRLAWPLVEKMDGRVKPGMTMKNGRSSFLSFVMPGLEPGIHA